ncbi:MAG: ImmA/IrrE family metallo-endopeptidase [Bacteroidetes bacterium]|nr:ImmA/IrrE family metallo-endopeptidase [Bacteroidota bacterium]
METQNKINEKMIAIARESRGLVYADIAEKLDVNKTSVMRWENNDLNVNADVIQKLTHILNYPDTFFYQKGEVLPLALSYRKRNKVASKVMTQIEANINIARLNVEQLLNMVRLKEIKLPVLDVEKHGTPQECAKQLRKLWKLEKGVLENLSEVLEQNKIILLNLDFNTDRVDGRCTIANDKYPIVVTNKNLLGDRQRFTLAYQLGHLVMHLHTAPKYDRDLSHEANVFAAELLMPEKEIKNDLQDLTLAKLGDLKRKWKVSMQSLMYRASDLELITENQKRYLIQQFNQQKIRRKEPKELDIKVEHYKLVRDLMTNYRAKQKLSVAKMAAFFHLGTGDFLNRYND